MDARTNERVLLRDLVKDGQTGLPVTRRSYDPKHPQEEPVDVFDPQALRRPAPDLDNPGYEVSWPTAPWDELWRVYPPLVVICAVGRVVVNVAPGEGSETYEAGVYEDGVYS